VLLYRGYPIEQLAQHCDFLEVCYLLLNGELPDAKQKEDFVTTVTNHTMVHEQINRFFTGFRRDAHPMATMVGVVGALSAFYHDALDINNPEHRKISAFRLIAKLPTITAMAYKYSVGQPFMYPKNDLSYTANFMRMMFAVPAEEYKSNEVLVRGPGPHLHPARRPRAERLHLDGAAGRLFGRQSLRLHLGGHRLPVGAGARRRERACLEMLEEIGDVSKVGEFIKKVKNKEQGVRLMGFGHRVYKNHDPRAKLMRETCHEVLKSSACTTTACSSWRSRWRRSRSRTNTSCPASSTRTWTSIRASCSARSASRCRCSPASSRSRAPWAGSRSGRR
jgi:citrate synthase